MPAGELLLCLPPANWSQINKNWWWFANCSEVFRPPELLTNKVTKDETRLPSAPLTQNPLLSAGFFFAFCFSKNLLKNCCQTTCKCLLKIKVENIFCRKKKLALNEQGLAKLGDLKNVKPGTADDWKTNVQDNNQKFSDVCPARTTAAMLLMLKMTTSCPNFAKPHVISSLSVVHLVFNNRY